MLLLLLLEVDCYLLLKKRADRSEVSQLVMIMIIGRYRMKLMDDTLHLKFIDGAALQEVSSAQRFLGEPPRRSCVYIVDAPVAVVIDLTALRWSLFVDFIAINPSWILFALKVAFSRGRRPKLCFYC